MTPGRLVPARLRPARGACSTRSAEGARDQPHLRARGGHPAPARRDQQERHRGAHPRDRAARLQPRLGQHEALLHDRPAHGDEADVAGIVETGARCLGVARGIAGRKRPAQVTCSVCSFVPKPHTPFQWAAMDGMTQLAREAEPAHRPRAAREAAPEVARPRGQLPGRRAQPRRPPPGRSHRAGLRQGLPLRRLGRALPLRPLARGHGRARHRPRALPGHPARGRAAALGPRRSGRHQGFPGDGVSPQPQGPAVAPLRQAQGRHHPPGQPGRGRRPGASPWSATTAAWPATSRR